ncbi:MAG: magnesium transporter CorA family protein [Gammaproteobacteria bacterium]
MIKRFQLSGGSLMPVEAEDSPIHVYINPDPLERNSLRAAFNIDEHTLSSALDPDEVSRIELNPDHLLLIWKRPTKYSGEDSFFFDVASIGLLLFKERLVVIVTDDIEPAGIGTRQTPTLRSPLDVMLRLLFSTIQHYLAHLKVIKMIARELQQKINTSMENKHLIQMFNLSESLVYYINAINSNGVVLTRLRNHAEKGAFSPEIIAFIDDLIIENNQCYRQAEIYSTVFSGLMDARGNLVNNNMSTLLKNLTLINVVFLPLNLIASIGGMSEFSMMTRGIDWPIAYSLFCVAMLLLGGLTAVVLKRVNFGVSLAEASPKKDNDAAKARGQ